MNDGGSDSDSDSDSYNAKGRTRKLAFPRHGKQTASNMQYPKIRGYTSRVPPRGVVAMSASSLYIAAPCRGKANPRRRGQHHASRPC